MIYVDDMKARYKRMRMCHMIADTDDELHEMARRIGVARRWFQGDHYDICLSKRALAVEEGAVEITWRECGALMWFKRRGLMMGEPADAIQRMVHHDWGEHAKNSA